MTRFQEQLRKKMHEYILFVYKVTKTFPKDELYGITSQIRRATVSTLLNYIEGYARKKLLVQRNFYEIGYGSLQESKYLLTLSFELGYVGEENCRVGSTMNEEIGAMLWSEINAMEREVVVK